MASGVGADIEVTAAAVSLLAALTYGLRMLWRILSIAQQIKGELFGEPETSFAPARPGVIARLGTVEAQLRSAKAQLAELRRHVVARPPQPGSPS
jgi:hypothetical protein